jgi:hypothetical protein
MTTIIQHNFESNDNVQSSDAISSSLLNSTIYLKENNNNNSYGDGMLVLSQIFEDRFVQLENEKHVIHTSSVMDENENGEFFFTQEPK